MVMLKPTIGIAFPSMATESMQPIDFNFFSKFGVVSRDSTAFTSTDIFGDIKTKAGEIGHTAYLLFPELRLECVSRVLNYDKIILFS